MSRQRTASVSVLILGLFGLSIILHSLIEQLGCEGQLLNHEFIPTEDQQIWGERVVSQSFVAPRNRLERIEVMFLTYQRQNTHDVEFRLLEVPNNFDNPLLGAEVFRSSFNAKQVRDQEWIGFTFDPIPDSLGKTYLISFRSPNSEPGDALATGGMEKDAYKPGLAYLGSVPLSADMTFVTCYDLSLEEKLEIFADQLTDSRPWLWGNSTLYLICLALYGGLLIGFFWQLMRLIAR